MRLVLCLGLPFLLEANFLHALPKGPALPARGRDLESFVPKNWKVIDKALGDLNKDGKDDLVAVIEGIDKSDEDVAAPRTIFVALQTSEKEYLLSTQSDHVILRADEGGVMGDPWSGVSINRGSFLFSFAGGSNWRWSYNLRFRFQDNDWFLIGKTEEKFAVSSGDADFEKTDYNLVTGVMIHTVGKKPTVKKNFGKKKIRLKDWESETQAEVFK